MKFTICHDTNKKTLAIPRAALQLSGLEDAGERLEDYRDDLMIDLYLRENAKSRPSFASVPPVVMLSLRSWRSSAVVLCPFSAICIIPFRMDSKSIVN